MQVHEDQTATFCGQTFNLQSRAFAIAAGICALVMALGLPSHGQSQDQGAKASLLKNYGKIPLHFEPNVGQSNAQAKFISRGNGYAVLLTPSEAVLVLRQPGVTERHPAHAKPVSHNLTELLADKLWQEPTGGEQTTPEAVLRTRLLGANPNPTISADEALPGKANYFIGNDPKRWHTNIPSYGKVKYDGVYPGVDLVYYGNQAQLEYDFVVAPSASPNRIRLGISGDEISPQGSRSSAPIAMHVDTNGDLVVTTTTREVRYQKPVAYQLAADGQKQLVAARFVLKSKNQVGFDVPSYDRSRALVIDPTLVYATYIAGATPGPYYFGYYGDLAAAIAVDSDGSAYVTGTTASGDFPITSGADQSVCKPYGSGCTNGGAWAPGYGTAVFVSKLSPDGSSLVYSTYIAGSITDSASGIAVDSSGNAYIAGTTNSPDFPITPGAYQTVCGPRLDLINGAYCDGSHIISTCGPQGYPDGFVAKLNPTGSALVYSTFLGGSLNDYLTGIAVDPAGEAYVSGFTLSSYSYSPPGNGCGCPNGPGTCDPSINVSASYGYPITPGAYQPGPLPVPPNYTPWPFGSPSAFTLPAATVAAFPFTDDHTPVFSKLSADGSTMLYSTYIGGGLGPNLGNGWGDGQTYMGTLTQVATGIAIDSVGDAYLTGYSNASDLCCTQYQGGYQYTGFPTTPGVVQPHNATFCANSGGYCGYDAFVAKFDPTVSGGGSLIYSTNLGGPGDDNGTSIAVDSGGNAYVAGTATLSAQNTPPTFPTTPGTLQPTCPGSCSSTYGWVTKLNPTATAMDYSTYLSGPGGGNSPNGVTVDSTGNAYVAGTTNVNDNFPQVNPLQGYPNGGNSAYISVLDPTASTLLFSSFLGGLGNNGAAGIALDSSDNIFVTGSTSSSSFPATAGAFQTTCGKCTQSPGTFVSEISAVQQNQPTLQSITVSPSSSSVPAGSTQQFTATGHYSNGTTQDLTATASWSSSNTAIATINSAGLATGIAQGGPITIIATQNSINGTAQLTVTAPVLQTISVSPASASIAKGLTQQFTAMGHYSDGSAQDVTTTATWSSSNTGTATISNTAGSQGLATAVAVGGPVTITATQSSINGTAQLSVTAPVLQSISVVPSPAAVAAGLTLQFAATGHYSDSSTQDVTTSVTWSSSNTGIATISNTAGSQGLATGVSAGGAVTITATQGAVNGTAQLSVTAPVLQSITVSPASASIAKGLTQQFTATGHYSDGSMQNITASVTWSSSNAGIASISNTAGSQGVATGVSIGGPLTITATQGVSGAAQLTVTAAVPVSVLVTPANAQIPVGASQQYAAMQVFSDGTQINVTKTATWASSNTAVATFGKMELAKAVGLGSTTISATYKGMIGATTLTTFALTVSPSSATIATGSTQQFTATANFANGSVNPIANGVSWSSSNMKVATINPASGLAKGMKPGKTTIKAIVMSVGASASLTVQ